MRVPRWLKNPDIPNLKRMIDKTHVSYVDAIPVLNKMPEHYQKTYREAKARPPVPVHYVPTDQTKTVTWDREHGRVSVLSNRKLSLGNLFNA